MSETKEKTMFEEWRDSLTAADMGRIFGLEVQSGERHCDDCVMHKHCNMVMGSMCLDPNDNYRYFRHFANHED